MTDALLAYLAAEFLGVVDSASLHCDVSTNSVDFNCMCSVDIDFFEIFKMN